MSALQPLRNCLSTPRKVPMRFFPAALCALLATVFLATATASRTQKLTSSLPLFSARFSGEWFTEPVFIKGPGDLVAVQRGQIVYGDLYFLHVREASDCSVTIRLHRMTRMSVQESSLRAYRAGDHLRLHLDPVGNFTLKNGVNKCLARGQHIHTDIMRKGSWAYEDYKMDTVNALSLLSRFRQQLHQNESIPSVHLERSDFRDLYVLSDHLKAPPDKDIVLDHATSQKPVTIGFSGLYGRHNINTSMLVHPANPAEGMVIGPILIKHRDGTSALYGFRFRALISGGYSVGVYSLNETRLEEEQDCQLPLIHGPDAYYSASMTVHWQGTTLTARVNGRDGTELQNISREMEHAWNPTINKISLIPLPDTSASVYIPGVGACINVLSAVVGGHISDVPEILDEQHMHALFTPQRQHGYTDGFIYPGAYYSSVPRNYQTLAPYRSNGLVRTGAWAAKKVLRIVPNTWELLNRNKKLSLAIGATALAAACYFHPAVVQTQLTTTRALLQNFYPDACTGCDRK